MTDCQNVIALFTYDDLGRKAGTLHNFGQARLDMQGITTNGYYNLQVQVGNYSVAAVLVSNTVLQTMDISNQKGISNAVISILNQSLDSGTIWKLSGSLP